MPARQTLHCSVLYLAVVPSCFSDRLNSDFVSYSGFLTFSGEVFHMDYD